MKSSVRQRRLAPEDTKTKKRKVSWHKDVKENEPAEDDLYLSWYYVLFYLLLIALMSAVAMYSFCRLPKPVVGGSPNQFHAHKAREHMEDLTSLGIRLVGSRANEVQAKELIVSKVEAIRAIASKEVEIEVSVHHPSGSYFVDFLGGITHIYQNITNIAVRLSRKGSERRHAFMINAHYDSALGSVAASDDAVSCATMLEVLRCLSSDPDPLLAEHALIFLFNGAEETLLQASHGFITQHPWAGSIRAFLNLEAAGAGGKEIVFQTGPEHPWLAKLYSDTVPHPHASVIAQEVFQSGVIPSDTDFRIFRDFGHIPGIDTAYFINGYVYHTEYDVPSAVPDGSIQRAGENVLALLRAVADSLHLSNPSAEDLQGKVVFTDILGLMGVVYPEHVAMVLNFLCALVVALIFVADINWSGSRASEKPSPKLFLLALTTLLLSWVAALVVVGVIATILTFLGRSMTWFAHPLLIIPLYMVPSVLAIGEVHTQLVKRTRYSQPQLEKSAYLSVQFLWSVVLVILTSLHICSAFIFLIAISFQLIFRDLLYAHLISPELTRHRFRGVHALAYVLCSALATGGPLMLRLQLDMGMVQLFVPLMGRSGAIVPPDVAIAVMAAVFVMTSTPYMVSVVVYSTSRQFKRWAGLLLLGISLLAIVATATGYTVKPYSVDDENFPRPKRLFLIHADRTFPTSSSEPNDSKVFLYPFDYLGMEPISEVSPLFLGAELSKCEGLLCREPNYIPLRHLINSWSYPASQPVGREGAEIKLLSSDETSENSKNMTFQVNFPLRCVAVIGMEEGVALKAWSLESYIPQPNVCPGSHSERGCYFIFHARGFGEGDFTFWIETEGDLDAEESLRIAVTAHHLNLPEANTPDLSKLTAALPEWVTPISWSAVYREWIF